MSSRVFPSQIDSVTTELASHSARTKKAPRNYGIKSYFQHLVRAFHNTPSKSPSALFVFFGVIAAHLFLGFVFRREKPIAIALTVELDVFAIWFVASGSLHFSSHIIEQLGNFSFRYHCALMRHRYARHSAKKAELKPEMIPHSTCPCEPGKPFMACHGKL
jgi:hypothetical protein